MQRRAVLVAISTLAWPALGRARDDPFRRRVLKNQKDRDTSLAAEAAGHCLVVVVMKGHWCRVCIAQLQRLARLQPRIAELDGVLVGLNADAPEQNRSMTEQAGIDCRVLSDEQHEVLSEFGLWSPRRQQPVPAIVLFDRCGKEAARWVGRRPGDRPERALMGLLQKLAERKPVCELPIA